MKAALLIAFAASAACTRTRGAQPPTAPGAQAPAAAADVHTPALPETEAPPAPSPAVPPAPPPLASGEIERARKLLGMCRGCHGLELLSQQRLTAKQWEGNVKKMRGWGAVMDDEEAILLVRYLSETPPGSDSAGTLSGAEAAAVLAPQPDGRFARGSARKGARLFESKCAECHGDDALGDDQGVNLTDRPILYRAGEFAEVVRGGRGSMAGLLPRLNDSEVASLLAWLRSLKPLPGGGS